MCPLMLEYPEAQIESVLADEPLLSFPAWPFGLESFGAASPELLPHKSGLGNT